MPWSALPEHLNTPAKWAGTDNDTWYARWTLQIQGWFAMGPRATQWWARWKFPPKVLFKIGGKGPWRYENIESDIPTSVGDPLSYYTVLSRCQYFKRWHIAVLWPLQIQAHAYWRAKDIPIEGTNWVNDFSICKLLFAYGPIHWDADLIYWILSFYIGGTWK